MDVERIARITNILRNRFPIDIVVKIMKEMPEPRLKTYILTIKILRQSDLYVGKSKESLIKLLETYPFLHKNRKEEVIKKLETKNNYYCQQPYIELNIKEIELI